MNYVFHIKENNDKNHHVQLPYQPTPQKFLLQQLVLEARNDFTI
ncbi:MAG: hypothetical protein ACR5KW_00065 [Wolbachia sp.]